MDEQFNSIFQDAAESFVANNQDDVVALGEDVVRAALSQATFEVIGLPELSADASAKEIEIREEMVTKRSQVFQVVATAQRQDNERVGRVLSNARSVALKVSAVALPLLIKVAVTKYTGA